MENNLSAPVESEILSDRDCANCGQPAMEGDHAASLCHDCRVHFTNLRIPQWIKVFAGGIGLIFLFSLFTLPRSLGLGLRLERGERAAREKNYFTAGRELRAFLDKMPDNVEARAYLMLSSFYNQDFQSFAEEYKQLAHTNIEDKQLYSKLDDVLTKAVTYLGNDSFEVFKTAHPLLSQAPDAAWSQYFQQNEHDIYARMEYSSLLFNRKEYVRCDTLLQSILGSDEEYFPALMMEASLKRETGDLNVALAYNDRMLAINHESAFGLASKARTLLRQKKDRLALDLAAKAQAFNEKNSFALASLILAYHFNGKIIARDALIRDAASIEKDANDSSTIQYALDVIHNKEPFSRN